MKNESEKTLDENNPFPRMGSFLIRLATRGEIPCFGKVEEGQVHLNRLGQKAWECLNHIPDQFSTAFLDEFIVMPDYLQMIMHLFPPGQRPEKDWMLPRKPISFPEKEAFPSSQRGDVASLWDIISIYKRYVKEKAFPIDLQNFDWERLPEVRLIKSEKELEKGRMDIQLLPLKWNSMNSNKSITL